MKSLLLAAGLLLLMAGCSSGGGSGDGGDVIGEPLTAAFTPSGTPASPNRARLTGEVSADLVTLNVVISGQTTSGDLYGFAFDLVLSNPGVAGYEDGTAVFGDALTLSGNQTLVALASQSGNRVTVGVSKLGGGTGNGIGPGEKTIVSLVFRVTASGSTTVKLEGSPPDDPAALDSSEAVIPSVSFDGASALITGS